MISILLPTRKRPARLKAAVASLADRARGGPIEWLLRVDDDDPTDYSAYRHREGWTVIGGVRHGYQKIHRYYNELAAAAQGTLLVVWNDDMDMRTDGWDLKIAERQDFVVQFLRRDISPRCDTAYPVFPKRLFDVMGHVAENCHVDSWLDVVATRAGIQVFRPEIVLHHHRLTDETASENIPDWEAFNGSPELGAIRDEDVRRIQEYMKGEPTT